MSMIDVHLAEKPSSLARFNRTGATTAFAAVLTFGFCVGSVAPAVAQDKPNIIFIMGDDIGWSNIGVYNQGIMAGRTPNLDRLASEGMRHKSRRQSLRALASRTLLAKPRCSSP